MIREATLFHNIDGSDTVICDLCHHRCRIPEGGVGICCARRNQGGQLGSLVYGRCRYHRPTPIEQKTLTHFLPGTRTMSYCTEGCNFVCEFCQNSA
ncbi:radical SAM protein, partial [Candidatus Hydrogenedentota bacterium]